MLIGKNWQVVSDELNVIVSRKKTRRKKATGEGYDSWEVVGYFATVEQALHFLINQGVRDTALYDLRTVTNAIKGIRDMIKEALQKCTTSLTEGIGEKGDTPLPTDKCKGKVKGIK